ncbi:type II toxin-antitoxin system prevent-host-death family antitoxin [Candidatus Uhrbacteria bacterium]|nr:type II toxin-antitoxin system prevent-host-death family antitoxin [Candidatus Uhrbacteria bacterium]
MPLVNTHEAKTRLSQLLEDVKMGKEVIIGKFGVPVARIVPFTVLSKQRQGGQLKGTISIAKDFDILPKNFKKHFTR